jgi:hypothetical protein
MYGMPLPAGTSWARGQLSKFLWPMVVLGFVIGSESVVFREKVLKV